MIGGYVRDIFLYRPSKDIDVVAVGSGIELAKAVAGKLGKRTPSVRIQKFRYGSGEIG